MDIDNGEEAQNLLNEFLLRVPQLPGFYGSFMFPRHQFILSQAKEMGDNLNLKKIGRNIRKNNITASEWSGFFVSRGWVGFQLKRPLDYNNRILTKENPVRAEYARIEIVLPNREHLKTDYFRPIRNINSWSRTMELWDITDLVLQTHPSLFINWNSNPFEVK
jgi:hypothetical protein